MTVLLGQANTLCTQLIFARIYCLLSFTNNSKSRGFVSKSYWQRSSPYMQSRGSDQTKFSYLPTLNKCNMSDEYQNALNARGTEHEDNIFAKIVRGEVPCSKVYEDEKCLAFNDVNPQAPVHILIIPKDYDGLAKLGNASTDKHRETLGHLMFAVAEIARKMKLEDFRVVINNGTGACQSVFYLHIHLMSGRQFRWPPG